MSQLIEILLLINIFSFTFDRYPMKLRIIHCAYHFQSKAMRVMQEIKDLLKIMEYHFQRAISQAVNMAVYVQMTINSGESEYQSSCAYHYSFLFSGWWFSKDCTYVALNGKYNTSLALHGFLWYSRDTDFILSICNYLELWYLMTIHFWPQIEAHGLVIGKFNPYRSPVGFYTGGF